MTGIALAVTPSLLMPMDLVPHFMMMVVIGVAGGQIQIPI
jgi:uncharacterized membrane protein YkvA (DUF1232 family)